jgi:arylsulfatase A-like enzyme
MRTALVLGASIGVLEVALRASARFGMSVQNVLVLALIAGFLMAAYAGVAAVASKFLPLKPPGRHVRLGWVMAAITFVQAALWYRFECVLNLFVRDPRVWGGLLAIAVATAAIGALLDAPLNRVAAKLERAAISALVLSLLIAVGRSSLHETGEPRDDSHPNVLFVSLDTMRADALQPYNGTLTPLIQRLADEGVVFDQAIAPAPITEPSHLAMLTGLDPSHSGVVSNGTLIGEQPTLVSHALKRAGYATAAFVAGFPLHSKYGWMQGFDVYDDDFGNIAGLHRLALVKAWDQLTLPGNTLRERRGDQVIGRSLKWLKGVQDQRWFAWVHLFDAHAPYEAPMPFTPNEPPPTDGELLPLPEWWPPVHRNITSIPWLLDAYHAEVRYIDALLSELITFLESTEQLNETLIILTADHGESLTEHDYLFEHGDNLYDPSLRIPLIVRLPGVVRAGQRVPCQVTSVSVAQTILDLTDAADGLERDGASLAEVLKGADCQEIDVLSSTVAGRFMENPPVDHSLRGHGRKLIRRTEGGNQLFDLRADPAELHNRYESTPDEAAALNLILDGKLAGQGEVVGPQTDAQTTEALRALGYVD